MGLVQSFLNIFWQYCMSLSTFLLIFFCTTVVSLSLLWYIQYMICKVHEALWDPSELPAVCKSGTPLFISIVTCKRYILLGKLPDFVKIEKNWSLNVLYHS